MKCAEVDYVGEVRNTSEKQKCIGQNGIAQETASLGVESKKQS